MEYQILDPVTTGISKRRFKTREKAEARILEMVILGNKNAHRFKVV